MKLSYNEATAKDCSTLEKDLILCDKFGFDYIEIRLDMLKEYLKSNTINDLKRFFLEHRLKPHAFNALYIYLDLFSKNDSKSKREELMEDFYLGLKAGKEIGSNYFVIVPPLQRDPKGGPFIGDKEDIFNKCVFILTKLSDIAYEYDMNLCFELVGFDRSSVRTISDVKDIVYQVNRSNVGFVFDSYNIHLNGKLNDFSELKTVDVKKIFAVHINNADDVPLNEMGQDKRRFCDRGIVNLDSYLSNLKEIGYDGMVSIEVFRNEYYQKDAEFVISEAYRTTKECLERNGCI